MLNKEFHNSKLIAAYLQGILTAEQQQELQLWLEADPRNITFLASLESGEELATELGYYFKPDREEIWSRVEKSLSVEEESLPVKLRLWPKLVAVAASVALVVLGVYFYHASRVTEPGSGVEYTSDLAPGKVGATLTLANGQQIKLSDAANGEIAKQAGISVMKTADGQLVYDLSSSRGTERSPEVAGSKDPSGVGMTKGVGMTNTLSTARGETYQVKLPDGSMVWLNAASSLTYSANLIQNGRRRVKLSGEAYLEVAKDKAHPFVVQTDKQEVTVLGTHFNINSYTDEINTKTTLLEGSVSVSSLLSSSSSRETEGSLDHANSRDPSMLRDDGKMPEATILKPGQQSVLTDNNGIKVQQVNPAEVIAWKNGQFMFVKEPIPAIMRKLARWYDVEVEYKNNVSQETFTGGISRYATVAEVLETLALTKGVQFKIEGRKIIVSN